MTFVSSFLQPWLTFLADDPALRALQIGMLAVAMLLIFLVFYATRDILQRTQSFPLMLLCIVLVALLPGLGFLIYLLIRPSRTLRDRENEEILLQIFDDLRKSGKREQVRKAEKSSKTPKESLF